jgi:Pyruvate/2-oxoacid:ferredoxin oxidoreductase gamma subunit
MITDVLVVGVGGQGVMTAAEAIARAALEAGYEATRLSHGHVATAAWSVRRCASASASEAARSARGARAC